MSSNTYFNSVLRAAGAGNQGANNQTVQEILNNIKNLQSQGIQDLPMPVQNAVPVQQMPVQPQTPQYSVGGFVKNFIRNAEDVGTGLVNLAAHPEQLGEVIGNAAVGAINNPEKKPTNKPSRRPRIKPNDMVTINNKLGTTPASSI